MALSEEDQHDIAWLVRDGSDDQIKGLCGSIGRYLLDADSTWPGQPDKVDELMHYVRQDAPLRYQLKSVETPAEQAAWLERVAEKTRYTEPEYDQNYALYYRLDQADSTYEWCHDPYAPGAVWMSQSAADAWVAGHVAQGSTKDGPVAAESAAAPGQPEWAWDDGWGMFYRIGAAGVYEYSRRSTADPQTPDGIWLSGEQVLQQRAQGDHVGQKVTQQPESEPKQDQQQTLQTGRAPQQARQPESGPQDVGTALAHLEKLGVTALREVLADAEALSAELTKLGIG